MVPSSSEILQRSSSERNVSMCASLVILLLLGVLLLDCQIFKIWHTKLLQHFQSFFRKAFDSPRGALVLGHAWLHFLRISKHASLCLSVDVSHAERRICGEKITEGVPCYLMHFKCLCNIMKLEMSILRNLDFFLL